VQRSHFTFTWELELASIAVTAPSLFFSCPAIKVTSLPQHPKASCSDYAKPQLRLALNGLSMAHSAPALPQELPTEVINLIFATSTMMLSFMYSVASSRIRCAQKSSSCSTPYI
jgi:hypothetical protein